MDNGGERGRQRAAEGGKGGERGGGGSATSGFLLALSTKKGVP